MIDSSGFGECGNRSVSDSWSYSSGRSSASHYLLCVYSLLLFESPELSLSLSLSVLCSEAVMMEDAQMVLALPVRTAGDVPLTLKERSATVT